jgi:hypothetical protein
VERETFTIIRSPRQLLCPKKHVVSDRGNYKSACISARLGRHQRSVPVQTLTICCDGTWLTLNKVGHGNLSRCGSRRMCKTTQFCNCDKHNRFMERLWPAAAFSEFAILKVHFMPALHPWKPKLPYYYVIVTSEVAQLKVLYPLQLRQLSVFTLTLASCSQPIDSFKREVCTDFH